MRFALSQTSRAVLFTVILGILFHLVCYSAEVFLSSAGSSHTVSKLEVHVSIMVQSAETNDDDEQSIYPAHFAAIQDSDYNDFFCISHSCEILTCAGSQARRLYNLYRAMLI